jgi:transcriptional regulator with XRE-family HTH domain/PAS domain-containing protein
MRRATRLSPMGTASEVGLLGLRMTSEHPRYRLFQSLLDPHAAMTIAIRVQLSPSVVDTKYVAVTPRAAMLFGYQEPAELEGQYTSLVHYLDDLQRTRLRSTVRALGLAEAVEQYETRIVHRSGEVKRVFKHVEQRQIDDRMVWIASYEPVDVRRPFQPPPLPATVPEEALHLFFGWACVAEVEALVRLSQAMGSSLPSYLSGWHAWPHTTDGGPESRPTLGALLRHARLAKALSLRQAIHHIAHTTGQSLSREHLSNVECGHKMPSLALLRALAVAFDLPYTVLVAHAIEHAMASVRAYLQVYPEHRRSVERFFHTARQSRFTGWRWLHFHLLAPRRPGDASDRPNASPPGNPAGEC